MEPPVANIPTPMFGVKSLMGLLRRLGEWLGQWVLPAVLIVVALALWELLVRVSDTPRWLLPPPSAIASELVASYELLFKHAVVTLEEVLAGFLLAAIAGVWLALSIAYWRLVERTIYPFVIASQTVPIIAIAPLLLIWIGYDIRPKIVVVALISFFPIVVNMVDGLRAVDSDMVNMLRTLGASRWQVFRRVQIPTSLPFLFSGMKIGIAVSVIGAVIGEWVGASEGLGYLMVQAAPRFQTTLVFAAIAILSAMGITLFVLMASLERLLLPWYYTARRERALTSQRE